LLLSATRLVLGALGISPVSDEAVVGASVAADGAASLPLLIANLCGTMPRPLMRRLCLEGVTFLLMVDVILIFNMSLPVIL